MAYFCCFLEESSMGDGICKSHAFVILVMLRAMVVFAKLSLPDSGQSVIDNFTVRFLLF